MSKVPKITTAHTDKKTPACLQAGITQIKTKITSHKKIVSRYFKLIIYAPYITKAAKPGQFVNIKVSDNIEPLLRRPFSIHRVSGSQVEIIYEVVGPGTEILSQRRAGEYLDVIGPLGNGFDYQLPVTSYQLPVLVAGGMGVAPLVFLAEKLANRKPKVLIGAKTKNYILCAKEFRELGCEVKIATDDGSKGFKGKATDLLRTILRTNEPTNQRTNKIYACGPNPMLKEIAVLAKQYSIPAQVSLEEHLACGIGACLGCVVKTKQGFKRVCKEGPVFNVQEIIW